MSKWLEKLMDDKAIECRDALEERAAIVQYDGKESESEYLAVSMFVDENKDIFKKHMVNINGEPYLKLTNVTLNSKI
ncbi:hypothetical protein FACS189472_14990 [Alphaproteobacteria bacterium]|nr:hypothetical protein FACS189472_14990 [Alphaproteobacteria bacterium]